MLSAIIIFFKQKPPSIRQVGYFWDYPRISCTECMQMRLRVYVGISWLLRAIRQLSVANPIYRRDSSNGSNIDGAVAVPGVSAPSDVAQRRWLIWFSRRVREGASITSTSKRWFGSRETYAVALSFARWKWWNVCTCARDVFEVTANEELRAWALGRVAVRSRKFPAPLERFRSTRVSLFLF